MEASNRVFDSPSLTFCFDRLSLAANEERLKSTLTTDPAKALPLELFIKIIAYLRPSEQIAASSISHAWNLVLLTQAKRDSAIFNLYRQIYQNSAKIDMPQTELQLALQTAARIEQVFSFHSLQQEELQLKKDLSALINHLKPRSYVKLKRELKKENQKWGSLFSFFIESRQMKKEWQDYFLPARLSNDFRTAPPIDLYQREVQLGLPRTLLSTLFKKINRLQSTYVRAGHQHELLIAILDRGFDLKDFALLFDRACQMPINSYLPLDDRYSPRNLCVDAALKLMSQTIARVRQEALIPLMHFIFNRIKRLADEKAQSLLLQAMGRNFAERTLPLKALQELFHLSAQIHFRSQMTGMTPNSLEQFLFIRAQLIAPIREENLRPLVQLAARISDKYPQSKAIKAIIYHYCSTVKDESEAIRNQLCSLAHCIPRRYDRLKTLLGLDEASFLKKLRAEDLDAASNRWLLALSSILPSPEAIKEARESDWLELYEKEAFPLLLQKWNAPLISFEQFDDWLISAYKKKLILSLWPKKLDPSAGEIQTFFSRVPVILQNLKGAHLKQIFIWAGQLPFEEAEELKWLFLKRFLKESYQKKSDQKKSDFNEEELLLLSFEIQDPYLKSESIIHLFKHALIQEKGIQFIYNLSHFEKKVRWPYHLSKLQLIQALTFIERQGPFGPSCDLIKKILFKHHRTRAIIFFIESFLQRKLATQHLLLMEELVYLIPESAQRQYLLSLIEAAAQKVANVQLSPN